MPIPADRSNTSNADASSASGGDSRLRRGVRLVRHHIGLHPVEFFTAVGGAAVFAICTILSSWAIRRLIDRVIVPRFTDGPRSVATVGAGVGLVIVIGFVRAAGVVVRRTFAGRAQYHSELSIIGELTDKMQAQPVSWGQRRPSGDLIARVGVDAEASVGVLGPLPFALSTVLLIVISAVWLIVTDPILGCVAVALFPVLAGLNIAYQLSVGRYFDEAQDHLGRLSSAVHESFEGVMVVKAFGAERREADRLATIAAHLRESRVSAAVVRADYETLLDAAPTTANIVLVLVGAIRVRAGAMTIGEITSFVYLFTLLVLPLRLIGYALSELPHSLAGWGRVREILDEPTEPDPATAIGSAPPGVGVSLSGVDFAYEPDRLVLDGLDLDIDIGRTVALVGATGSGKSTLLGLIAGLRAADRGEITRQPGGCALVFQEAFLLGGTIRDNVTLGDPVDDDAVRRALSIASALDFVDELPSGLDTTVGERGVSVSGGQRQRIALARALARQPRLLLLDDTTSALDPATEATILAQLKANLVGVTTLIVASRPSTIALADEVVFIADGRVAAQGPHSELVERHPTYRALVEAYEHDRESPGSGQAALSSAASARTAASVSSATSPPLEASASSAPTGADR